MLGETGLMPSMDHYCSRKSLTRRLSLAVGLGCVVFCSNQLGFLNPAAAQSKEQLTPIQREIERQHQRLSSSDKEEQRDALMRLGNMKRPDASRVAAEKLNDVAPMIRVAAMHAITSLPQSEAVERLTPLLQDKLEFVRREAAYSLGEVRSRTAIETLSNSLINDKESSVRAAAAIALGEIRDEAAVNVLTQVLSGNSSAKGKKSKKTENDFVLRAAAQALGLIRSRAAVPVLVSVLSNETMPSDVRREAATSLGAIGDPSAEPALRAALHSADPYLSDAARSALRALAMARRTN